MSVPITNHIMQTQNILLNQVPLTHHAIMTNVHPTNGIPTAVAGFSNVPTTIDQMSDIKSGIVMESMPIPHTNIVGIPATIPAQTATPMKTTALVNNTNNTQEMFAVINKSRLSELTRNTDPSLNLEEDVEDYLLAYTDDLIDRILKGASSIAKHRHVNTVEVKDVQLYLTKNYGIWAPGFGTDELKPYKRSLTAESHKQRLALIRKALKKY